MTDNAIRIISNIPTSYKSQGIIYSGGGCCPTLLSRDCKDAKKILVRDKVLGTAYSPPKNYHGLAFASGRAAVYDINGVAPTLVAATGGQ